MLEAFGIIFLIALIFVALFILIFFAKVFFAIIGYMFKFVAGSILGVILWLIGAYILLQVFVALI